MIKPVAQAVEAVAKIAEIKALAALGTAEDEHAQSGERLVKGQSYTAQVLARLDARTVQVAIQGQPLSIALQAGLEAGQTVRLQYLGDHPTPTFKLLPPPESPASSTASLSQAAQLIDRHLHAAQRNGESQVYEAARAVISHPANPAQLATALKQAVSESGLFYESHLAEFVEGTRSLADIKQEAQSRENYPAGALLVKQLGILEHQRLLWHGEVWPGQNMEWEVQVEGQEADEVHDEEQSAHALPGAAISSSMTLQLPHLGKVNARIALRHGALHIQLSADQPGTIDKLSDARADLLTAIEQQVQPVTSFAVVRDV